MKDSRQQRITGDCINASFQGYFSRQNLQQDQSLNGTGIIIDDEFNFFLSHWKQNRLNGPTLVRTISNTIIYGLFQQNIPKEIITIEIGEFQIFLKRQKSSTKRLEWAREAVVLHSLTNMFYAIELTRKQDHQGNLDLDSTQKISNCDSYRIDKAKIQWKVKIIERCNLKSDGSLAVFSKYLKVLEYKIKLSVDKNYSIRQQNIINLISIVMGGYLVDTSIISLFTFLKKHATAADTKIDFKYLQELNHSQEPIIFLGIKQSSSSIHRVNQKNIGITIDVSKDEVKSLGSYSKQCNLHGLGIQFNKFGQSYIGMFKQNLLVKQYKHNSTGANKNISSLQISQLLAQQHLKSINYIHHCHYIPELTSILGIANKITKYVTTFEKEYEKRHLNYNDTLPYNSSHSSEAINIHKYIINHEDIQTNAQYNNIPMMRKEIQAQFKKPGFILNKSKSKQKSPTPTDRSPLRKTPEKQHRVKGKIYDSQEYGNIKYSPNRFIGIKNNQQTTIKKNYNY